MSGGSGTGRCLRSSFAAGSNSPNVHNVDFATFYPLRSEHSQPSWFFGFTCTQPPFCTLAFARHSIPHHPPNVSINDTMYLIQLARFSILYLTGFRKIVHWKLQDH